jgi:hypothetical protein
MKGTGLNSPDDFVAFLSLQITSLSAAQTLACTDPRRIPLTGGTRRPSDDDSSDLPPTRTSGALEWANDTGGNPTSIEIADLRLHAFIVDPAFIDV